MLTAVDAALSVVNRVLMGFTAALIVIMAAVITADVVGRNLNLFSLPWSAELAEYGLYLSAILIAPWLLRRGQHISIGILVEALPASLSRIIIMAVDILCAAVSAALSWYGLQATLRSHSDSSLVIKNVVFQEWWVLAPFAAIFLLLAVEFVVLSIRGPSTSGEMPL